MADEHVKGISLKALVDKGNNRVIFAESDGDFIDVLFSLLTLPMGTIIRLTRNQPPTEAIGCMNNLYESVENLDRQRLQTDACKTMLLYPRSGAETHCRNLKVNVDNGEPIRYFLCCNPYCTLSKYMSLSHYRSARCGCGEPMNREIYLLEKDSKNLNSATRDGGVFVKGLSQHIISDELNVMPLSTTASFSLLSKFGIIDGSTIEERTFYVGVDEVLNLLKCSLLSKTPLTEALLKHKPVPLGKENSNEGSSIQCQIEEGASSNEDGKICVKLVLSKSKKMVCYAEAGEDFVDLLFSFLTVPLGYTLKAMQGSSSKGCIYHLYKSVLDLDSEKYLKSDEHKAMLVNPKLAPGFGYENQPLGIEEALHQRYHYAQQKGSGRPEVTLTTDETLIPSKSSVTNLRLTVMDPKSHKKEATSGGGFVIGPTMFTITDNLIITPVSPISGISLLNTLKVPFSDIEERVVSVGKQEALRLLVASFVSQSALTNAFVLSESSQSALTDAFVIWNGIKVI